MFRCFWLECCDGIAGIVRQSECQLSKITIIKIYSTDPQRVGTRDVCGGTVDDFGGGRLFVRSMARPPIIEERRLIGNSEETR